MNMIPSSPVQFPLANPRQKIARLGSAFLIGLLADLGGSTPLETLNGETWQAVTAGDYASKISSSYSSGLTTITTIPEPGPITLLGLG